MPRTRKGKYPEYTQVKLASHLMDDAKTLASWKGETLGDFVSDLLAKVIAEQMPEYLREKMQKYAGKKGRQGGDQ